MLFSRGLVVCMLMANVHVCGSMLTKPSPAKLIVLREKWLIQRGQANYACYIGRRLTWSVVLSEAVAELHVAAASCSE